MHHGGTVTIRPDKVAVYIRWSTEDQSEGTTLEVQRDACTAYCTSQGWIPSATLTFVDDGYSGGSLDRPALTRLRAAVSAGCVDCVVVYKLDRLSRSVLDMVRLVCGEWEGRCYVKSAREPVDTTTHAGRMFFYTLVNFAEWERAVIRERTQSGKLRRAQEGRNPGIRPPYGYRLSPAGSFVIVADEAAIVRRVYDLYQRGLGCRAVVAELARTGSRPRYGDGWAQSSIAKILRNPIYCGTLVYGRVGDHKGGTEPADAVRKAAVVREQAVPAIIPRPQWEAVQTLKQSRPGFGRNAGAGSGRSQYSASLLTGLLRCRCGHAMGGSCAPGKAAQAPYRYYYCLGRAQKGADYCAGGRIPQQWLDQQIVGALRQLHGTERARELLLQRVVGDLEAQLGAARATTATVGREAQRLESAAANLGRLLRDGEITAGEYRRLQVELERDQRAVREQLARAQVCSQQALAGLQNRQGLAAALAGLDAWQSLAMPDRKRILQQLIRRISAYRQPRVNRIQCEVEWRWNATVTATADGQDAGEPVTALP